MQRQREGWEGNVRSRESGVHTGCHFPDVPYREHEEREDGVECIVIAIHEANRRLNKCKK